MILDIGNLRFTSRAMRPDNPESVWLIDVERISDSHGLPEQMWFDGEPTLSEMNEAAAYWIEKYPGFDPEPAPVHCLSCNAVLLSDNDTDYQFDNALWVGFFGGYGMFVESLAGFCNNSSDRWTDEVVCRFCRTNLHHNDNAWVDDTDGDGCPGDDELVNENKSHSPEPVENPDWVPEYDEPRILPGRPEHEAVICHACAHALCEQVPWIGHLLDPYRSHTHRADQIPLLYQEGHRGCDLDFEGPEAT